MFEIKIQSEYEDLDKYQYNDGDVFYLKKDTDILHNPYGAAYISKDGFRSYHTDGKRHRLDGPTIISEDGLEIYYIDNIQLTKKEFEIHPKRLKFVGKEHLICLT